MSYFYLLLIAYQTIQYSAKMYTNYHYSDIKIDVHKIREFVESSHLIVKKNPLVAFEVLDKTKYRDIRYGY